MAERCDWEASVSGAERCDWEASVSGAEIDAQSRLEDAQLSGDVSLLCAYEDMELVLENTENEVSGRIWLVREDILDAAWNIADELA